MAVRDWIIAGARYSYSPVPTDLQTRLTEAQRELARIEDDRRVLRNGQDLCGQALAAVDAADSLLREHDHDELSARELREFIDSSAFAGWMDRVASAIGALEAWCARCDAECRTDCTCGVTIAGTRYGGTPILRAVLDQYQDALREYRRKSDGIVPLKPEILPARLERLDAGEPVPPPREEDGVLVVRVPHDADQQQVKAAETFVDGRNKLVEVLTSDLAEYERQHARFAMKHGTRYKPLFSIERAADSTRDHLCGLRHHLHEAVEELARCHWALENREESARWEIAEAERLISLPHAGPAGAPPPTLAVSGEAVATRTRKAARYGVTCGRDTGSMTVGQLELVRAVWEAADDAPVDSRRWSEVVSALEGLGRDGEEFARRAFEDGHTRPGCKRMAPGMAERVSWPDPLPWDAGENPGE